MPEAGTLAHAGNATNRDRQPVRRTGPTNVDAGLFGARRQRSVDRQHDGLERNVGELARVDVVKVVMRARRRIVELARGIHVDRAQQAALTEQIQRVVNGRLRNAQAVRANRRDDLLGRQMLRRASVSSAISTRCAVGNTPRLVRSAATSSRVIARYHTNQRLGQYTRDSASISKRAPKLPDLGSFAVDRRAGARVASASMNQRRAAMPRAPGFTLWELLCTLGVAAVTLGAGIPSFRSFLLDARLTADVNAWVLAVQLARSEAAKRGRPVMVCRTADSRRCATAQQDSRSPAGWYSSISTTSTRHSARRRSHSFICIPRSSPVRSSATGPITSSAPAGAAPTARPCFATAAARRQRGRSS